MIVIEVFARGSMPRYAAPATAPAGIEENEREVTSSIQRNVTRDQLSKPFLSVAWSLGALRRIGFDCTTAYGLRPERSLGWILLIGIILTPTYMRVMLHPSQRSRIVQVFPQDKIDVINSASADSRAEHERIRIIKAASLWTAFGWAAYLSLLSAVNIGFQQFTPGDWIRRLQEPRLLFATCRLGAHRRRSSGANQLVSARNVGAYAVWPSFRVGRQPLGARCGPQSLNKCTATTFEIQAAASLPVPASIATKCKDPLFPKHKARTNLA